MINLKKDFKVTPEDTVVQEQLRKEKRVLNLEEYLAFLQFVHDSLGGRVLKGKFPEKKFLRQFEL
jgi:hypothetical protein